MFFTLRGFRPGEETEKAVMPQIVCKRLFNIYDQCDPVVRSRQKYSLTGNEVISGHTSQLVVTFGYSISPCCSGFIGCCLAYFSFHFQAYRLEPLFRERYSNIEPVHIKSHSETNYSYDSPEQTLQPDSSGGSGNWLVYALLGRPKGGNPPDGNAEPGYVEVCNSVSVEHAPSNSVPVPSLLFSFINTHWYAWS